MNKELIFFRLLILVFLSSLLVFGGHSFYYPYKASEWREQAIMLGKETATTIIACKKLEIEKQRDFGCDILQKGRDESSDVYTKTIIGYDNWAEIFSQLSYYVPIISIFLFYGGRWIVLGRLKPLIPKKDSGSSTGR